jgi:hypothetical protein
MIPGINKLVLANSIRALIEDMAELGIDNRHVPSRNVASLKKHLGTISLMAVDSKQLLHYHAHLLERRHGENRTGI